MKHKDIALDDDRRRLLLAGSVGIGLAARAVRAASAGLNSPAPPASVDKGSVSGEKINFAPISADTEAPIRPPPGPDAPGQRIGFAVMGLGRLALENILPAFAHCKHARLAGLISGSPSKLQTIATQYGIAPESCYGYDCIAMQCCNWPPPESMSFAKNRWQ